MSPAVTTPSSAGVLQTTNDQLILSSFFEKCSSVSLLHFSNPDRIWFPRFDLV